MAHIPLRLRIDASALVANWRSLAGRSGPASCGAAVKANGYGVGAQDAIKRLAAAGCRDFFVSTWAEAEAVMPWTDGLNLSVLHGVGPDDIPAALASPARPVLNSVAQLARWREAGQGRPCDIMVDTGMNRLGIGLDEIGDLALDGLYVDTLMSHLACADTPNHPLNGLQLDRFRTLLAAVPAKRRSLANSAGIFLGADYAFDLTRPGLALYGGVPVPEDAVQSGGIRQVVTPEAQVIQVRTVPTGDGIGYGATFVAPAAMHVAILNIGYADGFRVAFGAHGRAMLDGRPLPIVGRISMDLIAVDLGRNQPMVREGDWLGLEFSLPALAAASGLSQYELLTGLGDRFERLWV